MDLRRKRGKVIVNTKRCYYVDDDNQPIPEMILPPCVVLTKAGVNFSIEYSDIDQMIDLLWEARRVLKRYEAYN